MGLDQLPDPKWPKPPPSKLRPAPAPAEPEPAIIGVHRSLAGLSWPDGGFPAFCLVLSQKPVDRSRVFETVLPAYEIISEFETFSFIELCTYFKTLRDFRCATIYTSTDPRFYTYIREFIQFKRTENARLSLKTSRSSSFEASIVKIKDIISSGRLIFNVNSKVKAQLAAFSRADLKNEQSFFAIRALSMVINSFSMPAADPVFTEEINPAAWY